MKIFARIKKGIGKGRRAGGMVLLTAVAVAMASTVCAEIFYYRDSQGVLHFTNVPTSAKYKEFKSGVNSDYDDLIEEAAREKGLPFYLIKALIQVESSFDPYAVSKRGAMGLMQIMPENLEKLDVDNPYDPRENIKGGATYLKAMIDRFPGNLELALAAYNAGPSAVEKYSDIPPYKETKEYVKKVMELYKRYRNA